MPCGEDGRIKKMVVVGDGGVGKTALLMMYKHKVFPEQYIPTVFENYETSVIVDGKSLVLSLVDTAGQEGYDTVRLLSYPGTHAFIVCFDVTSTDSFANIKSKWLQELKCENPQILLVGTKSDLRTDKDKGFKLLSAGQNMVTESEAKKLAHSIKAYGYVECSALTKHNVDEVFEEAMRAALSSVNMRQRRRHQCNIL